MPKKILIAIPTRMLEEIDHAAYLEHRNRSDLVREALRRYLEVFKRNQSLLQLNTEVKNGGNNTLSLSALQKDD